ncbi:hypothetical protein SynA1528_01503 [Synechococcus sp. A15-28]|nr:hypothetical protein SynA1528_01503 [Synechococcus sp. A15-28]
MRTAGWPENSRHTAGISNPVPAHAEDSFSINGGVSPVDAGCCWLRRRVNKLH